jgi:putative hydrolase of the HAD superfamily
VSVVFWDFDETLAERNGRWWGCLVEIIEREYPGHAVDQGALRQALQRGYPWHYPDVTHVHLNEPDAWWAAMQETLVDGCMAGGLDQTRAHHVAAQVRYCYATPDAFTVYADTIDALELFRAAGWKQAIVSNHVPELDALVRGLALDGYFDVIFSSARTGFEKPHPRALQLALAHFGVDTAWMIGNSETADIAAADAVGIPSVLVKRDTSATPLVDAARHVLGR